MLSIDNIDFLNKIRAVVKHLLKESILYSEIGALCAYSMKIANITTAQFFLIKISNRLYF